MNRFVFALIVFGAATLGCARQRYPDDPFKGPAVTADPSASPAAPAPGFQEVPLGPGNSYAPDPSVQPGTGLQSSYTSPARQSPGTSVMAAPAAEPPSVPTAQPPQPDWTNSAAPTGTLPETNQPATPAAYVDDPWQQGSQPEPPQPPPLHGEGDQQFGGRDPDFRWIRGKLDYVAMDQKWQVRYAPYSVEDDRFGGSLLLENDPRLKDFQPGDVVEVEGELVDQPTRMIPDNAVYRIKQIRKMR